MKRYDVRLSIPFLYEDIEAKDEEEAEQIAREMATADIEREIQETSGAFEFDIEGIKKIAEE